MWYINVRTQQLGLAAGGTQEEIIFIDKKITAKNPKWNTERKRTGGEGGKEGDKKQQ